MCVLDHSLLPPPLPPPERSWVKTRSEWASRVTVHAVHCFVLCPSGIANTHLGKKNLACFWNIYRYRNKNAFSSWLTPTPTDLDDKRYSRKRLHQWPSFTDTCLSVSREIGGLYMTDIDERLCRAAGMERILTLVLEVVNNRYCVSFNSVWGEESSVLVPQVKCW